MTADELGDALRSVLAEVDQVPDAAMQAAHAALAWRNLDTDLARLTAESELELTHLRGGAPRLLTFQCESTVIELEVSAADGSARLVGQLDPPREADVTVESAASSHPARSDHQGRFSLAGLPDDWIRVIVTGPGAARTATEWFRP